jgi:hypothetical protein
MCNLARRISFFAAWLWYLAYSGREAKRKLYACPDSRFSKAKK